VYSGYTAVLRCSAMRGIPKAWKPTPGRCRNCREKFTKKHPDQLYCSKECKNSFNNLGSTPEHRIRTLVERKLKELVPKLVAEQIRLQLPHVLTRAK